MNLVSSRKYNIQEQKSFRYANLTWNVGEKYTCNSLISATWVFGLRFCGVEFTKACWCFSARVACRTRTTNKQKHSDPLLLCSPKSWRGGRIGQARTGMLCLRKSICPELRTVTSHMTRLLFISSTSHPFSARMASLLLLGTALVPGQECGTVGKSP